MSQGHGWRPLTGKACRRLQDPQRYGFTSQSDGTLWTASSGRTRRDSPARPSSQRGGSCCTHVNPASALMESDPAGLALPNNCQTPLERSAGWAGSLSSALYDDRTRCDRYERMMRFTVRSEPILSARSAVEA